MLADQNAGKKFPSFSDVCTGNGRFTECDIAGLDFGVVKLPIYFTQNKRHEFRIF